MAIVKKPEHQNGIVIDLTGPDGNAFVLLGYARRFACQLDLSPHEIETVLTEMKSGDYEHLVSVFDDNFGKFVTLLR